MNELSEKLKPYKHLINHLADELGFNPSEGCETFKEMIDNIKNHQPLIVKDVDTLPHQAKFFEVNVVDQDKEDGLNKKIIFSSDPNDSLIVDDEIQQKKKTYIPPVPEVDAQTLENRLKEFEKRKQKRQTNKNKQKTSIFSSIINKIKKQ
jgi:hypothetical protein